MLYARCLLYRKVDDTSEITSHDLFTTLGKLNNIVVNVYRLLWKVQKDGKLEFLNCLINVNENRELRTEVYRKPMHNCQYIHFSLNQPLHVKISTIKTLKEEQNLYVGMRNH